MFNAYSKAAGAAILVEWMEDSVEDTSPRLVYNPDDGSVMLQTSGPAVTVDGIVGEVGFERITPEGESALALWLDPPQADVLAKMIRYILEKVLDPPRVAAAAARHPAPGRGAGRAARQRG